MSSSRKRTRRSALRAARDRADDPPKASGEFPDREFLLEKGALDMVVERKDVKDVLVRLLDYGTGGKTPSNGQSTMPSTLTPPPVRSPV